MNKKNLVIEKRIEYLIYRWHPNLMKFSDTVLRDNILYHFYLLIQYNSECNTQGLNSTLNSLTVFLKIAKGLGYISTQFFIDLDSELSKIKKA